MENTNPDSVAILTVDGVALREWLYKHQAESGATNKQIEAVLSGKVKPK